jgi:DNA-binding transcriptional ArsR family regulator
VSAHEISHDIVVVAGAGASHNLTHPPMPLMTEWVNSLITDLESEDPFLASQIGLERDLPGPEVESRIGDFLADALGAGRSNISNHLACLRGCGLVRTQREGRQVRYERVSPPVPRTRRPG